MNKKLGLAVCNFLIPEISEIINRGEYENINLIGYPSVCLSGSVALNKIKEHLLSGDDPGSQILLLASNCFKKDKIESSDNSRISVVHMDQCLEIFIDYAVLDHFIQNGCYVVSNGWLRSFRKNIQHWGFETDTAKNFFSETINKILLLDTMIPGDYLPALKELSAYMGVPYEIIPVGLTHCESFLFKLLSEWQSEIEQNEFKEQLAAVSRQTADYSFVFTQLNSLVSYTNENDIINGVFEMLNTLYAPVNIIYYKYFNNEKTGQLSYHQFTDAGEKSEGVSFEITVSYQLELLGMFSVVDIPFPQFIEEYKQTGILISDICALAISNARKFELTEKQNQQLIEYSEELKKITQSKDIMYSVIAHDLRSPFNAILGFSSLLIENRNDFTREESDNMLELMNSQARSTLNLLENLLLWTSSQTGKIYFFPEKFDLSTIINDEIDNLKSIAFSKNINIIYADHTKFELFADTNMLKTILRNIITNSIKYTPQNGSINIRTKLENNSVKISISDTGIGMSKEKADSLFSGVRVESLEGTAREKGAGIGLQLCKDFVLKHGGEIWAESNNGPGSTLNFTIPLKNQKL